MSRHNCPLDCKVYVGGLPRDASRDEIERKFGDFGKLTNVFVARNPPGFAFIEYDDPRDASDAVRALDGRMLCGVRARVELSHGKPKPKRRELPRRPRRSRSGSRERRDRDDYRSRRDKRERSEEKDSSKRRKDRSASTRSRSPTRSRTKSTTRSRS